MNKVIKKILEGVAMKIKHNFILMLLVASLLVVIVILNSFNLLNISRSYYNNFELVTSSKTIVRKGDIKFIIQAEENDNLLNEIEKILINTITTKDKFNFIIATNDEPISINNKENLSTVLNQANDLFATELEVLSTRNNFNKLASIDKIIILTDGKFLNNSISFLDFKRLRQMGIKVHIIQLTTVDELTEIRLKSLAELGGGEYLNSPTLLEINNLLRKSY